MKTLQEKYNAILEGNFSKKQFVRDARLAHSSLITQFNSFADTVAILKNKGMVVEAKKAEVTAYMKPEVDPIDMVAPDLLDHGIEAELHAAGITGTPSEEEYAKAKEKAAKELIKDPLCYKNAQTMTEPGEKMEKAKLSEETALDRAEDYASRKVQDRLRDIADTVAEKPASVGAAFREKALANPTHFGKMSAHELEKEFKKFKLEEAQIDKEIKVTKKEWPYVEFEADGKEHKVEFNYEDIIDDHGTEGQDQYWLGKDEDGKEWSIDVYAVYNGDVQDVHYDTISANEEFDKISGEPDPEIQEAKDLEISPEQMEKLHKDGKITLSNGSVLHATGTGMKETQLKEAIKSLIKKTLES
tara:strand:- start:1040 stop:2113 length:1074 start_codon:yes stop_codon:yes gene_type:complete